jgi:RNA polymerase sigma-70 factor (ECF subfamily)
MPVFPKKVAHRPQDDTIECMVDDPLQNASDAASGSDSDARTDPDLVRSYVETGSEGALAELIARHGSTVYAAALRVLGDRQAAEDAVQMTFLLFCRKAAGLGRVASPGAWLYESARLTAMGLRRDWAIQRKHEREAARRTAMESTKEPALREIEGCLDEALAALPARLRDAIVLRYLGRQSEAAAARELGCSRSAFSMRVARGLARLRRGFARRGAAISGAALLAALDRLEAAPMAPDLPERILAVCMGKVSAPAAAGAILDGVARELFWVQAKSIAGYTAVAAAAAGAAVLAIASRAVGPEAGRLPVPSAGPSPAALSPRSTSPSPTALSPLRYDWSAYHGPNGNFTGAPAPALVEDLNEARLVWVSRERQIGKGMFSVSGWALAGTTDQALPGGNAGPIVYDGKVYLSFFRPAGEAADRELVEAGEQRWPGKFRRGYYLIEADDVMLAVDARTGETAWKKAFAREGLNRPTIKRGGWGVTPAAHAGRVFAMTTMGRILAFDAATGQVLWRADNGCLGRCEEEKAQALEARKQVKGWVEEMNAALAVIGGVLLAPDWAGGVIGMDPADGRRLWHRTGVRSGPTTPAPFRHGGREYAVVGGGNGELRMLDPLTGNDLWKVEGLAPLTFTLTCADGHVFVMTDPAGEKPGDDKPRIGRWSAYRISPTGAERAWTTEHACEFVNDHGPHHLVAAAQGKVTLCRVYGGGGVAVMDVATGKTLQRLDLIGAIGHVWGDRRVFRSGVIGDSVWSWFTDAGTGLKPCGAAWRLSKRGEPAPFALPVHGYSAPTLSPFVDGFLFQRTEEDGGAIRCYDLRKP